MEHSLEYNPEVHVIQTYSGDQDEPYWKEVGNEKEVFNTCFSIQRPLVLKGPTGCGKTTFVRRMYWELGQKFKEETFNPKFEFNSDTGLYVRSDKPTESGVNFPLYIVDGTEDTEVIHILGGYNHTGKFIGGPLYHWAHTGGILLVNELAEIRSDVQTLFHGPLDKERLVTIPDLERVVKLPDHAMMVATYNPGYQAKRHPLKISTKQRLPALSFNYPNEETEAEIIYNASVIHGQKIDRDVADRLAKIGAAIRQKDRERSILASKEGVSTRLLVMAAEMIGYGLNPLTACKAAIVQPLAQSEDEVKGLEAIFKMHGFE